MLSLCCHVILGDSSLNNPTSHPHSPCGRRSRNARVVFFCGVQVVLYLEAAAAMSGEAEALLVVNQLRDLAADPMNRRAIVQDQGCLPGLILFLDHPNPQVVYSALLALRYLAECRANREKMEGELGMMLSLQNVIQKSTTPGETKLLASEVYELLQASSGPESDRAEGAPSGRRKAQFFLGSTNKRAKTVVLHIDGLDDSSHRTLCEEALLKIRGVISFTFQMAVKRCIVRIRSDLKAEGKFILQPCSQNDTHKRRLPNLTPQKLKGWALASAIASTEVLTAQQVVKGENGQEILIPFTEDGSLQVEQNVDLPDYLPEEEAQAEEPDKAVTRVGNGQDGATWLGTAANFLSRSFYW
ncbi:armadillo repeat-containing protein 1-like isoform X3 [Gadus macrocephalus]|uniref:armadillo repeat-containing protein 1-like isoform X3 n=1 Tax=Gadus macrocephalus TaxID=80720 RepID=UPI0028CBB9D5|nr:armadillo repeat-containing protein 1-like isoform X3 [Gadus macrocephalus]